ncbi:beta-lactamase-like protein [Chytridium lagenaria]|nr:beta-lactamase-like protein [Chytridium lagenaria]
MSMDIVFLGTASAQPSPTRNHSSLAFRYDGDTWLFDCGEGTQHQLIKAPTLWPTINCTHAFNTTPTSIPTNLPPPPRLTKISKVFLTHLHGDHCFGLPGLLCTVSQTVAQSTRAESARTENAGKEVEWVDTVVLEVYGPVGAREYVRNALKYTMSRLGCRYVVHELHPTVCEVPVDENLHPEEILGKNIPMAPSERSLDVVATPTLSVRACPIVHTVPTVGYVIEESPVKGRLRVEIATPILQRNKQALGLKNPLSLLSKLKAGETLTMPDGTVMTPEDLVEPDRKGRCVVILGDTSDPSGMEAVVTPVEMGGGGCDVIVHEATNACTAEDLKVSEDPVKAVAGLVTRVRETAISHGHSTPDMAGRVAKRWGAKKLLLNHFSSRYGGDVGERVYRRWSRSGSGVLLGLEGRKW